MLGFPPSKREHPRVKAEASGVLSLSLRNYVVALLPHSVGQRDSQNHYFPHRIPKDFFNSKSAESSPPMTHHPSFCSAEPPLGCEVSVGVAWSGHFPL